MNDKNQPISGNDLARFSGPNTFMRLPSVNDLAGLDVAVLGVPMDIGTSWRPGTRFGPKEVRSQSAMLRPYNLATGAAPFDSLQVADVGDLAINTFSLSDSLRIISESYDAILNYVLGLVWLLALLGAVAKMWFWGPNGRGSLALYLTMGWLAVLLFWPMWHVLPPAALFLVVIGGTIYSVGAWVFAKPEFRYQNAIWHSFVLSASTCFFAAVAISLQVA